MRAQNDSTRILRVAAWIWIGYLIAMLMMDVVLYTPFAQQAITQNPPLQVRKPMLEIFPQLRVTRITHAWGGTLGISLYRMPHFERLRGNILTASGYSGHGVALATLGGRLAAEAIAGEAERFDLMARVPTRPFPGGTALRWPLLVLAMAWFSLRDRL